MKDLNFFGGDFDRSGVEDRLRGLCSRIAVESEIIVIGASSILLNYNTGRRTQDVDIISKLQIPFAQEFDVQVVNEGILFLLPDYRDRLVYHFTFGKVNVYALSGLDVCLVKLGRGIDRDIKDIQMLIEKGIVSLSEFKEYYPKFRSVYGGSHYIIDENYFSVTGERYESNDRMF